MGLYQLTSTRKIQGVKKVSADLIPIVFNLTTEQVETDQTRVDQLFRRSQVEGLEHNASNKDTDAELINDMSYDFADIIRKERTERMQKEFRQNESDRMRNEQQARIYYTTRLEELEQKRRETEDFLEMTSQDDTIKSLRKRLSGYRLQINKLEKERDERLALINEDKHLEIKEDLVALNLITII
jgi:hypothetical protein